MTSPTHGRRAAPKPTARLLRTRSTRESAARPTRRTAAEAAAPVRTAPDATQALRCVRRFSVIAMTFVGGMMIATSVPALAITATDSEPRASVYAPAEDSITLAPQTHRGRERGRVGAAGQRGLRGRGGAAAHLLGGRERRQRVDRRVRRDRVAGGRAGRSARRASAPARRRAPAARPSTTASTSTPATAPP